MEIEIASPNEKEKMQMRQYQAQVAPLAQQQKGMAGQMGDMVKQKLMSDAASAGSTALTEGLKTAGTSALGTGAMTGMATAVPYVGAGLLAGKALGLFNQGGQIGPLSPRFQGIDEANLRAMQDRDALETAVTEEMLDNPFGYYFSKSSPIDYFIDTPYSYNRKTQYKADGGMTKQQAMALMNNQPDPDKLYNEIVAESMTEAAQQQMPQPKMRPPLMVDPYGADTTYDAEMYKQINT